MGIFILVALFFKICIIWAMEKVATRHRGGLTIELYRGIVWADLGRFVAQADRYFKPLEPSEQLELVTDATHPPIVERRNFLGPHGNIFQIVHHKESGRLKVTSGFPSIIQSSTVNPDSAPYVLMPR
jgi:hypothetical protein